LHACICNLDTEKEVDAYKLARCIEQLYAARHNRLTHFKGATRQVLATVSIENSGNR